MKCSIGDIIQRGALFIIEWGKKIKNDVKLLHLRDCEVDMLERSLYAPFNMIKYHGKMTTFNLLTIYAVLH